MERAELVALLRDAVATRGGRWADLGAGDGAFTFALADLLGPGARITAIDRDAGALKRLASAPAGAPIETVVADFTHPLNLSALDGVVMANSLHFVRDKAPVLAAVRDLLLPGGTLIVVEYETDRGNPWVPHPFSFRTWEGMTARAGFEQTRLLHRHPSRHFGSMYSAGSIKPLAS
ncbi:MAG TPA: class I SAM-dependent methyltransferase [Candidatus Acidoferrum sp.]|jgi:ubiquinone/menaquinone biosynthesis C-methylase UbiE|nr:class I SAM-dependent methyltransferase [Candidatus Acidoferrum sp.]